MPGLRLASVLYNLLETIRVSLVLLTPFIPDTCAKAFAQIGAGKAVRTWDSAYVWSSLPQDVVVQRGETLFPRVESAK